VSAARSPILYQYVLQNLGKGVPRSSLMYNSIVMTRATVQEEARGPRFWQHVPNEGLIYTRLQKIQHALDRERARVMTAEMRKWQALQMEMLWRDQAQRQKILEEVLRDVWQASPDDLRLRLSDEHPFTRWLAVNMVSYRRLPCEVELIGLLADGSEEVRAAARQALVRLSRGCDFGPPAQATAAQYQQAVAAWRRWLALQDSTGAGGDAVQTAGP
jgi:hypothetical protein